MKQSVGPLAAELVAKLEEFHEKGAKTLAYLKSGAAAPAASGQIAASGNDASPARTHARPQFTDDEIARTLSRERKWEPDFLTVHELESSKKRAISSEVRDRFVLLVISEISQPSTLRFLAQTCCVACPAVHLAWTEDKKLFLINRTEKEQRISGELFGFNTGKFEEKVKGRNSLFLPIAYCHLRFSVSECFVHLRWFRPGPVCWQHLHRIHPRDRCGHRRVCGQDVLPAQEDLALCG